MVVNTEELKKLTEDERTAKFKELKSKPKRTPDETEVMQELTKIYNSEVQLRVDKYAGEAKTERYAREQAEKRARDAEEERDRLVTEREN